MKPIQLLSAMVMVLAVGCGQTTTSNGPGTLNDKHGNPIVKTLSMTAAPKQTIVRGGTDDMAIKIRRKNFNDPVTIRLSDLPQGVEAAAKEIVIPAGEVSATLKLRADQNAKVGDYKVEIDAEAPGLYENVQTFTLSVTDKEKETELPRAAPY